MRERIEHAAVWLARLPAFCELERFDCRPVGYELRDEQAYWRDRRRRDLLKALRGAIGTTATRVGATCGSVRWRQVF